MTFFHGTTQERWAEIQLDRVLWGKRAAPSRCTYLTTMKEEAQEYGDVVLAVEYTPGTHTDNYVDGCWQFRVYGPIPLDKVRALPVESPTTPLTTTTQ